MNKNTKKILIVGLGLVIIGYFLTKYLLSGEVLRTSNMSIVIENRSGYVVDSIELSICAESYYVNELEAGNQKELLLKYQKKDCNYPADIKLTIYSNSVKRDTLFVKDVLYRHGGVYHYRVLSDSIENFWVN